jgi:DNA-binding transcriptional LysR family regulator
MDPGSSVRKLVDQAFESIGEFAKPAFEATYMSTAAGMVKAGLGVTILPSSAFDMGELTGLRTRPINSPALTREIGAIERSGRSLSPAAESFLKTLKAVCQELRP